MKTKPLNNSSSGIEVCDLNLKNASDMELRQLGWLVVENLIVVIRNQQLSFRDEVRVCQTIGDVEAVPLETSYRCPLDTNGGPILEIQRVTGKKYSDGRPMGLFGHDHDLDWHANRPSAVNERKPLIWLHAVEGSVGSRTSWANCAAAYEDLDLATKNEISDLLGIFGFEPNRYTTATDWKSHRNLDGIPIVQTIRATNKKGLYFPFLQLFGFKDKDDGYSKSLIQRLTHFILQEKYIYHHDWTDGDIVISEQWLTIHKRWAFDVSHRILHRISFDYNNVKFNL